MTATRNPAELTRNEREAISLFGTYTAGSFQFWHLSGNPKAGCRAHIMSALRGMKVPQAKAGVTALTEALMPLLLPAGHGLCRARAEDEFARRCRESGIYTPGKPFAG